MSDDLMRPIYEMQQNHRANRGAAEEIDAIDQVANHIEAQAAEIARLRDVSDEVKGYLSRMLQTLHPRIDLLPTVLGVCTQIDHVLAGQREEIARLRAALATARMELEHAARQIDCQCGKRDLVLSELRELGSLHAENVCPRDRSCLAILAADIRAAAKEDREL